MVFKKSYTNLPLNPHHREEEKRQREIVQERAVHLTVFPKKNILIEQKNYTNECEKIQSQFQFLKNPTKCDIEVYCIIFFCD